MTVATLLVAVAALLNAGRSAYGTGTAAPGYWKGVLDIVSYDYTTATEEVLGGSHAAYNIANVVHSTYKIYQNPTGTVRRELTFLSRNRVIEPSLDYALFDYGAGHVLAWDKGSDRVERSDFRMPASPSNLGTRSILGHLCTGYEYNWEESGAKVQRVQWFVTGDGFRDPLLDTIHIYRGQDILSYIEIRVMTRLDAVGPLPATLFEPPPGMPVYDVGRQDTR